MLTRTQRNLDEARRKQREAASRGYCITAADYAGWITLLEQLRAFERQQEEINALWIDIGGEG